MTFNINAEDFKSWMSNYCLEPQLSEHGEIVQFNVDDQIAEFVDNLNIYLNKQQPKTIYELVFFYEDHAPHHVALSHDKSKLQALIDKVKAIDEDYNRVADSDESLEEWEVPNDHPLYMIKDFDAVDWSIYDGEYAQYSDYLEIHERNILP